jgi:hypothetical protein
MKKSPLPDFAPVEASVSRFAQLSEQAAARTDSRKDLLALRDAVRGTRAKIRKTFEATQAELERRLAAAATGAPQVRPEQH